MDPQQFVREGVVPGFRPVIQFPRGIFEQDFAGESISVGVQAVRSESDQPVAGANVASVQDGLFFHGPDDRSVQVVLARPIKTGHLGRFAADERTTVEPATLGDAADDRFVDVRFQNAGSQIVQEEQRFRPGDGDVVDAMIDEVFPDRAVPVGGESHFEFGSYPIHAGDQHRASKAAGRQTE